MIIDAISNGIVIDHISAGKAMYLYNILGLDQLDCSVALLKNVVSSKLGRKDIIKIDRILDLDWDVIGYVDPGITVNIIKDGQRVEKRQLKLPERIRNVIRCKNPRCITSVEQELPQIFTLTDREKRTYRCLYLLRVALQRLLQGSERLFFDAGDIGAADAAFRRDLPLRERRAVAKAVAQGDDHPLPRRQHCVHDLVELPVGLPCAEILEQILIRAQHIHQRQRVPVLPGLNAVRKRNIPRRLPHRPKIH